MKTARIILTIVATIVLLNWVRDGATFPLSQTLPFKNGGAPGLYDIAACLILLVCAWRLFRVWRARLDDDAENTSA